MMIFLQYALVGLVGGLVLIFLSKTILAKLLRKDEDFYERNTDQGGEENE